MSGLASAKDAAAGQERAEGLVNTKIDAKAENDLRRRDALLVELCELHKAWPQDAALTGRNFALRPTLS